jgi:hypothetical protein
MHAANDAVVFPDKPTTAEGAKAMLAHYNI